MNFIKMGTGNSKRKNAIRKLDLASSGRRKACDEDDLAVTTTGGKAARARRIFSDRHPHKREIQNASQGNKADENQPSTQINSKSRGRAQSPKRQASRETTASPGELINLHESHAAISTAVSQSPHQVKFIQHAASFGSDILVPGSYLHEQCRLVINAGLTLFQASFDTICF